MNASGYADLLAKSVAGADWILADAAGRGADRPRDMGDRPGSPAVLGRLARAGIARGEAESAPAARSSGC